jgi:hypothetical protein
MSIQWVQGKCASGTCVQAAWVTACNDGACVEVAQVTACGKDNCVEVAHTEGMIAVRDSKHPEQPPLLFTPDEWVTFLAGVREHLFDFGLVDDDLVEPLLDPAPSAEERASMLAIVDGPYRPDMYFEQVDEAA